MNRFRGHRALLLLAGATLALVAGGCGRLDRDAVQTEVQSAASAAAEGAMVAHEAERGRTFTSFVNIRTAELHKVAKNIADDLQQTPPEHGLEHAAGQGMMIAEQIAGLLDDLHKRPDDRALAGRVRRDLDELASEASEVAEAL
jgi:hypothetical protein